MIKLWNTLLTGKHEQDKDEPLEFKSERMEKDYKDNGDNMQKQSSQILERCEQQHQEQKHDSERSNINFVPDRNVTWGLNLSRPPSAKCNLRVTRSSGVIKRPTHEFDESLDKICLFCLLQLKEKKRMYICRGFSIRSADILYASNGIQRRK